MVSVRDGLLAVLTLGPAYGAHLHSELIDRLGHRRSVNIGQVYATLERLSAQGLVRAAGVTDDGLPLYQATDSGRSAAHAWLTTAHQGAPDWAEMLDAVLMASSLPGVDADALIESYRSLWEAQSSTARTGPQADLAAVADDHLRAAALGWLGTTQAAVAADAAGALSRGASSDRPRRGRRPSAPGAPHFASA